MPLFVTRKKYFDYVRKGRKDVVLRRLHGSWKNARLGDAAVLLCGREVLKKQIKLVHRGSLEQIFSEVDFGRIVRSFQ